MSRKVTIVGAGTVGEAAAFNIAIKNICDELVLIDLDEEKTIGEATDIGHSIAFESDTEVHYGDYDKAAGSDIVVVTAGKPRKPGMTRLDLANENADIIRSIFKNFKTGFENTVFITTTNPMDVMNLCAYKTCGLDRRQLIGFGGWLDSSRLRYVLAHHLDAPHTSIDAYVLGEHGDSQVPVFSQVYNDGEKVEFSGKEQAEITEKVRGSAMSVIEKKGGTEWAPARGIYTIVQSIFNNEKRVIPCSAVLNGEYGLEDVSIGVPCVIGRRGIEQVLEWELSDEEREGFKEAGEKISAFCGEACVI